MSQTFNEKFLSAQKAVRTVHKGGKNSHFKYSYVRDEDVIRAVSDALSENDLAHYCSVIESNVNAQGDAYVVLKLIIGDSTERIECTSAGFAKDKADKAIYKAITGAKKYAYMLALGLASTDDVEQDEPVQEISEEQALKNSVNLLMKEKGLTPDGYEQVTGYSTIQGLQHDQLLVAYQKLQEYVA